MLEGLGPRDHEHRIQGDTLVIWVVGEAWGMICIGQISYIPGGAPVANEQYLGRAYLLWNGLGRKYVVIVRVRIMWVGVG